MFGDTVCILRKCRTVLLSNGERKGYKVYLYLVRSTPFNSVVINVVDKGDVQNVTVVMLNCLEYRALGCCTTGNCGEM